MVASASIRLRPTDFQNCGSLATALYASMLQPLLPVKLNNASAISGTAKNVTQPATTVQRPKEVRRWTVRVTMSTGRRGAAERY